jgi:hypothetical protein
MHAPIPVSPHQGFDFRTLRLFVVVLHGHRPNLVCVERKGFQRFEFRAFDIQADEVDELRGSRVLENIPERHRRELHGGRSKSLPLPLAQRVANPADVAGRLKLHALAGLAEHDFLQHLTGPPFHVLRKRIDTDAAPATLLERFRV